MLSRFSFFKGLQSSNLYTLVRYASQSHGGSVLQNNLQNVLKQNFPKATNIVVQDISGGCGAMFEIYIVSSEFKGMSKVKQHLSVSQALKNEIKDMHGLRIFTETPDGSK